MSQPRAVLHLGAWRPRDRRNPSVAAGLHLQAVLGTSAEPTRSAPATWAGSTKEKARRAALRGTWNPHPMLLLPRTAPAQHPQQAAGAVVDFGSLVDQIAVLLQQPAGYPVRLDVLLDTVTTATAGNQNGARPGSASQYQTIQAFLEAYGVHQALRSGGLYLALIFTVR